MTTNTPRRVVGYANPISYTEKLEHIKAIAKFLESRSLVISYDDDACWTCVKDGEHIIAEWQGVDAGHAWFDIDGILVLVGVSLEWKHDVVSLCINVAMDDDGNLSFAEDKDSARVSQEHFTLKNETEPEDEEGEDDK